jgi:hypothetical protein
MFALLAYSFVTLFTGIALYGHVLLLRDMFSDKMSANAGSGHHTMRQQKAA